MKTFGKLIDDIKSNFDEFKAEFNVVPFGHSMTLSLNNPNRNIVIDSTRIGNIEYSSSSYDELLKLILNTLREFKLNESFI